MRSQLCITSEYVEKLSSATMMNVLRCMVLYNIWSVIVCAIFLVLFYVNFSTRDELNFKIVL